MKIVFRARTVTFVLLAGVAITDCADRQSPTRPDPPATTTNSPSTDVVRILVKVPVSLAPQESAQLQSTALNADGSTEDVTARTQWSTSDPAAVRIEPGGIATAFKVGEVAISAVYQSASGTRYGSALLVVLVRSTYKLSGRITDAGVAIPNVNVVVSDSSGADLQVVTNPDGAFAVYGVAGRVQLRASREGYATVTHELEVRETTIRNLEMVADRVRPDLSGTYALVLSLGTCDDRAEGVFETEFARRRYLVALTQTGPRLAVSLGGADFILQNGKGNHFSGSVDSLGNVRLEIGNPNDLYLSEYPDLAERVTPTGAFLAYGTVKAQATATTVIGTVSGPFIIAAAGNPSFGSRSAWCYSDRHGFDMRRQ
jgi:hypothetical protein